jgi:DNA repair protein RecO (recombination protein O)
MSDTISKGKERRVSEDDAAFVLQSWNWKETSLLVEFFTLKHGKVIAVARGAKRAGSHFRGLLTSFSPLKIGFTGQNEVKNLMRAQWLGGFFPIEGEALISAFYVNELLIRLLPREDPMPELFSSYAKVLEKLADPQANHTVALRTFELELMERLGYGLPMTGEPWYWDGEELKPWNEEVIESDRHLVIDADMIRKLHDKDFRSKQTLAFAKVLMRKMIAHYAGDKPLNTRRIFEELKRY